MGKSSIHERFHLAMFDCRRVSTKNDGPWPSDFAYAALDPWVVNLCSRTFAHYQSQGGGGSFKDR